MSQDNNEAASALHSAIMSLPCKVPKAVFVAWTRAEQDAYAEGHKDARHAAAELVAAAEATIAPVPRVGGNTSIDTFEFAKVFGAVLHADRKRAKTGSSTDREWLDAYGAFISYIDNFAHVARQRQESLTCPKCGVDRLRGPCGNMEACGLTGTTYATPSAAVAEGVDTPELRKLLQEWGRVPFQWDALIAYLTDQFAQRHEAGRRERDQDFGLMKLTLEQERLRQADAAIAERDATALRVAQCAGESAREAALARQPVSEELTAKVREIVKNWEDGFTGDDVAIRTLESAVLSAVPPAKAEGISDTERDAARWRFSLEFQDNPTGTEQPEAILAMWRKVYAEHRLHPTREEYEAAFTAAILAQQAKKGGAA